MSWWCLEQGRNQLFFSGGARFTRPNDTVTCFRQPCRGRQLSRYLLRSPTMRYQEHWLQPPNRQMIPNHVTHLIH